MSKVNWKRLLDTFSVEYIEKGSSVVRGNIAIHCPFCGNADPSHHLGINLSNGAWGCWRNNTHRGRSPIRLLMALLNVSFAKACELAGVDEQTVDPDGWEAIKNKPFGKDSQVVKAARASQLRMPDEFHSITTAIRTRRAFRYLEDRGFPSDTVPELCRLYRLRTAISGDFKDRVIIPYYVDAHLMTWTGRAIGETKMRYLDLAIDKSIVPPKKMLFNFNATRRTDRVLLVVEGPMDALKADMFGRAHGVRAVALSTNSITDEQTYLLEEVSSNFKKVFMVMDSANSLGVIDSLRLKEKLTTIKNIGIKEVPEGYKDFGEMPPDGIIKFCKEIVL